MKVNTETLVKIGTAHNKWLFLGLLGQPLLEGATDEEAEAAQVQWKEDNSATLLGIINGVLPLTIGKVLVKIINDETQEVTFDLRDPWWDRETVSSR